MSSMTHTAVSDRATRTRDTPNLVVFRSLWGSTLPGMLPEREQRDRFSYALRKAMDLRGASARQVAIAMDVDPRRVAGWLKGRTLPNLFESQALASLLRVDERLFREPPAVPPPPPEPYYPLAEYLLDQAAVSGAGEAHRRESRGRAREAPDTPPGSRARPPRAAGSGRR